MAKVMIRPIVKELLLQANGQRSRIPLDKWKEFERPDVQTAVFRLVDWLRYRSSSGKKILLDLNLKHPWCQIAVSMFEQIPELGLLFSTKGEAIDFADSVSSEEQAAIEKYSEENYRPKLLVNK